MDKRSGFKAKKCFFPEISRGVWSFLDSRFIKSSLLAGDFSFALNRPKHRLPPYRGSLFGSIFVYQARIEPNLAQVLSFWREEREQGIVFSETPPIDKEKVFSPASRIMKAIWASCSQGLIGISRLRLGIAAGSAGLQFSQKRWA
jgi:hypothetical protein